jgi:hypothetical protein
VILPGDADPETARPDAPIGRTAELEALAAFLGSTWPRLLLVEGPAGIGKSTLLEAALADAPARGIGALIHARGTEAEQALPYAALTSLLPDERVRDLLPVLAPPRRAGSLASRCMLK